MKLLYLIAATLFFGATEITVAQQKAQPDAQTETRLHERDVREIERLEDEWNTINEVSDVEGKRRLLAEDSYHVGPSGRLYNKAQDIEATKLSYDQKQASGSDLKFIITNRRFRLNGDIAVVTMTGRSVTTRDGTQREGSSFRAVHVWERREGRWQIVVDQVTGVSK